MNVCATDDFTKCVNAPVCYIHPVAEDVQEVGCFLGVGDGNARIYGFEGVKAGETVEFQSGLKGLALKLDIDAKQRRRMELKAPGIIPRLSVHEPTGAYHGYSDRQLERINVFHNEATSAATCRGLS